ncbi:trypsin-like serine protease [Euzebya sp.]|uniref:trypsin-like serine protease n=1 Tax=Euzebya sp. TaxID=1971409 RepID=UPI0035162925
MKLFRTLAIACLVVSLITPAAAADPEYQIVDGEPAADGAYPWMAAFLFDGGQGCGASVIAPQWILTAAHCVLDDRGQPAVSVDQVSFAVDTTNWTEGGQVLTAAEIIAHPSYDPLTTNNDVALVRTNEAAQVTPVALAGTGEAALEAPPTVARVIGYGALGTDREGSEQLLQVDVDVRDDAVCAPFWPQWEDLTMLCAGNPTEDSADPGRDSCQGDSGGPLFVERDSGPVQIGIVSYGGECGVGSPGVYAQVSTFRQWIDGIVGGQVQPDQPDPGPAGEQPDGAAADPLRVGGDDPVANAIAMSQLIFQGDASFGVLAASANFPDALGGSALASYHGPLLYVDAAGQLGPATLAEFQRTVPAGGVIYILGGVAAVSAEAEQQLIADGFEVVRLGGSGRQETARLVAEEVIATVNGGEVPPFDSVIVAYEGNWPDAVAVGQISAWFGIPVLLTPTDTLGGPAAEYLSTYQPTTVMVLGGDAVIGQAVRDEIEAITGPDTLIELQGPSRIATSADITVFNRYELFPLNAEIFEFSGEPITEPEVVLAVNLRRDDAFAHVLAASQVVGNVGGVFAPLEGDGSAVEQSVLDSICGLDAEVIAIGSTSLVADAALAPLQAASAGQGCAAG